MKPLLPLAQLTLTLLLMAASVGLFSVPGLQSLEQQLDDWRINLFQARLDPAFLVPPMAAPAGAD